MTTVQQKYKNKHTIPLRKPNKSFKTILLEAVDEGLSYLGKSAKQNVYHHLKHYYGIKEKEIPEKIEEFEKALNDIFGPGSKILQIKIMEKLHQKVKREIKIPNNELRFIEYIKAAAYSQ